MNKYGLILITLFFSLGTQAQTFTDTVPGPINEVNVVNSFPLEVYGLPNIDSVNFGLLSICFDLHHTYDGDLKIKLQAPDGTEVILSDHNGGSGDNYTGTCVAENATNGAIQQAAAPYTGTFYPQQSINHVNNNQDPNGTWYLIILDEVPQDTGHLNHWSVTFGDNPPPTHIDGVCSTTIAHACDCPDGSSECDLLPDMTNSGKYIKDHWTEHSGYLTEGVATPNIGWGPLEMHGTGECYCDSILVDCAATCLDGSYPKEKVLQTIYHKKGDTMTSYTLSAGYMTYHPTHGHIHVDNWTINTLRIRGPNPDPSTWPIVGTGTKNSFCLINLGTCTVSNAYCTDINGTAIAMDSLPNGGLGSVTGCGEDQGIYVGRYDAYDQYLDGQTIDFGNVCNGEYYIVSQTDPYNAVTEIIDSNNTSTTLIQLVNQQGSCCTANFYADTTYGQAPFEVQFVDSTIPMANSWLWEFGDGGTSTEQFPIHVYTEAGTYNVTLTTSSSNGCSGNKDRSEYIVVDFGVAAPASLDPKSIRLTCNPNPFTQEAVLSFNLDRPASVHAFITDITGNTIRSLVNEFHHSGISTYVFDAGKGNLPAGIYFVHTVIEGNDFVVKMVKM
jgi:subtilisin-like proprotein convertase family protein